MKTTILITLLSGLCLMASAHAEEKTLTLQQQRMTTCNQQATSQSLKGDARKTYMSDCLKNGATKPGEKSLTRSSKNARVQCPGDTADAERRRSQQVHERVPEKTGVVLTGESRLWLTQNFILSPLSPSL